MAGKRTATTDLNHDNWDREDEAEEAGTFKKASVEVLKNRVIKMAKRRGGVATTTGNDEDEGKKPVFGGFTGFKSFAPPNPNAAFSFLNNSNTVKSPTASTPPTSKPFASSTMFSSGLTNGVNSSDSKDKSKDKTSFFGASSVTQDKKSSSKDDKSDADEDRPEYYAKLKGLNESVLSWIEKHVKENPFINLKPIFTDYERYFTELEVKHVAVSAETKKELVGFAFKSPAKTAEDAGGASKKESKITFDLGDDKDDKTEKSMDKTDKPAFGIGSSVTGSIFGNKTSSTEKFTFGSKPLGDKPQEKETTSTAAALPASSFVFGSANAAKSQTTFGAGSNSLFGAKSTSAFSFGAPASAAYAPAAAQAPSETINLTEEEDDEPPKVEFTPVVEQDHIYTIRCKVFVKNKEGAFGDRGVGNLYLKKVPDSEKVQLIVRADTNLGNLLCNFILSKAVPTQRMGKKDVMLVCVPTPEEKPPPMPMLLRVKNEQEADGLLKELEKHKK